MKKVLLIILGSFAATVLWLSYAPVHASDSPVPTPGIAPSSGDKKLVTSTLNTAPSANPKKEETKAIPDAPKAKKKDKADQQKEDQEKKAMQEQKESLAKKEKESKKVEQEKKAKAKRDKEREAALEKASKKFQEKTVDQQVTALREDRSKKMPYLDRVYIQTRITPLKIQKKAEFLSGGPKDLEDLILRAESVSSKAKADHENIALYQRRTLVALRKLFPELSVNLNHRTGAIGGQQRTDKAGFPIIENGEYATGSAGYKGEDWHVKLRQPLFNGGILWNTLLQEKANLQAAKKQFDRTIAELVYDLSKAYFEYQRTLQTVEEHKATLAKMKRYAEMSEEKFRQKIISEMEHLNVQSLYSSMQFDLESATQELELAKLDIQKYLDLAVNDDLTLAKIYDLSALFQTAQTGAQGQTIGDSSKMLPGIFKGDEKSPELPQMIDLSYGNRPELQVEAAKLQAFRLGEKVRWGEFLPKAYLTYDRGELGEAYVNGDYGALPPYKPLLKKDWSLMLEVNWNLGGNKVGYTYEKNNKAATLSQGFATSPNTARKNNFEIGVLDGLDAFVNVKQAEVDKLNQVAELEKAEKQVLQDVKQAYYDYQKSVIQVRSVVKKVEYRKRMRDFTEHKLVNKKEGAELSELLQSESDLTRDKAELHKALKEYFTARASLNHAIGIQNFWAIEDVRRN